MGLLRSKYEVAYRRDGNRVDDVVTVVHADRVRAEREARKRAIPPVGAATSMEYSSLWVWAALVRSGGYAGDYTTFLDTDLLDLDPVTDADGEPVTETVDPTQPAPPAGSPSPSPATTAAAPTTG